MQVSAPATYLPRSPLALMDWSNVRWVLDTAEADRRPRRCTTNRNPGRSPEWANGPGREIEKMPRVALVPISGGRSSLLLTCGAQ